MSTPGTILLAAERQRVALSGGAAVRLATYLDELLAWGASLNLTAARDLATAVDVLVEPSLAVAHAWHGEAGPTRVLDVGSGNGFPGVVAAALWPAAHVWFVERRAKKARAIAACLGAAGFERVAVLACDARELPRLHPDLLGTIDLVTVRAVGALDVTTRLAAPLLAAGGRLAHWKALDLDDVERRGGVRAARALGLRVLPEVEAAGARGRLVLYARAGGGA